MAPVIVVARRVSGELRHIEAAQPDCAGLRQAFHYGTGDRRAVIAFRGTLISSPHNLKADLDLRWDEAPPRHHGFNRAWREMEREVCAWLAQNQPKWITLTGHSLGGAIATVAALEVLGSGMTIDLLWCAA